MVLWDHNIHNWICANSESYQGLSGLNLIYHKLIWVYHRVFGYMVIYFIAGSVSIITINVIDVKWGQTISCMLHYMTVGCYKRDILDIVCEMCFCHIWESNERNLPTFASRINYIVTRWRLDNMRCELMSVPLSLSPIHDYVDFLSFLRERLLHTPYHGNMGEIHNPMEMEEVLAMSCSKFHSSDFSRWRQVFQERVNVRMRGMRSLWESIKCKIQIFQFYTSHQVMVQL